MSIFPIWLWWLILCAVPPIWFIFMCLMEDWWKPMSMRRLVEKRNKYPKCLANIARLEQELGISENYESKDRIGVVRTWQ